MDRLTFTPLLTKPRIRADSRNMLASDDFLRRLPRCIQPVERLRFETLLFAHDLMEIALDRLYAVGCGYDENSRIDAERFSLFSDAWTIIDQVHVVRQVLKALTKPETRATDTQAYIDDFATAQSLRNRMDHLNQNLPNRAKAAGSTNAMFGMLSFFRPCSDRWADGLAAGEIRGDLFLISAGSAAGNIVGAMPLHEMDIHLPICSFKLDAFDMTFLLERAVLQLRPLLRRLSGDLLSNVEARVDDLASASGLPRDELLRTEAGHIVVRMDMCLMVDHTSQPSA